MTTGRAVRPSETMLQVVPKVEHPHKSGNGAGRRPSAGTGDGKLPTDPAGTKMSDGEDDDMAVGNDDRPVGLRQGEQPADMGRRKGLLMGSDREGIDGRLGSGGQDEHGRCSVSQIAISPAGYARNHRKD